MKPGRLLFGLNDAVAYGIHGKKNTSLLALIIWSALAGQWQFGERSTERKTLAVILIRKKGL